MSRGARGVRSSPAAESAAASPYRRTAELARVLAGLADISKRLREGPLGRSLKDECVALGLDYRPGITKNTSKKVRDQFRFRHEGHEHVCEEHVALGGGTYAPEDCLRIYFCSGVGVGITIAYVGRHLDTDRTS